MLGSVVSRCASVSTVIGAGNTCCSPTATLLIGSGTVSINLACVGHSRSRVPGHHPGRRHGNVDSAMIVTSAAEGVTMPGW